MTWAAALLAAALAALWLENKTPKQAFFSVVREVLKGTRRLGIPFHTFERVVKMKELDRYGPFPYKRNRERVSHLPLILNVPTSEGSGEAAHPDVVYVPDGWGAGRWTWLMSATPYPSGSDFFENPELYVSHDGIRWTRPAEGVNPLARIPAELARRDLKKEYHSDASLLLHDGILRVYYRWSGVMFDKSVENRVYAKTSRDGIAWNDRVLLFGEKGTPSENRGFLSPSVMYIDGKFVMWTVEQDTGRRIIVRRSSDDGLTWSTSEKTSLESGYATAPPWHLDVISCAETGGSILILVTAEDRGFQAELHYGFGDHEGRSWRLAGKLIEPEYSFEARRIYRSSLVPQGKGSYALFYSALGEDGKWSVARLDLRLDTRKMIFECAEDLSIPAKA
jgi:hypothetical protein